MSVFETLIASLEPLYVPNCSKQWLFTTGIEQQPNVFSTVFDFS